MTKIPGRCSKPMWSGYGMPAGFCDEPAWGPKRTDLERWHRAYEMYVPWLACPNHGGPEAPESDETPSRLERDAAEQRAREAEERARELEASLAATERELERWKHNLQVEGDYVCPDSLRMTELEAGLRAVRVPVALLNETEESLFVRGRMREAMAIIDALLAGTGGG